MCDTPIARATGCMSSIRVCGRRLPLELACTRVNKLKLINLCTESVKTVFDGTRFDGRGTHHFIVYQVYSCMIGDGKAFFVLEGKG